MDTPNDYKTAGIFMIVSGILTFLLSAMWVLSLIWVCVGVLWLIPMVVGVGEIALGAMVLQGKPMKQAPMLSIAGIVAAVLTFNWIGVVMEILAQMWFRKPEVAGWLEQQP